MPGNDRQGFDAGPRSFAPRRPGPGQGYSPRPGYGQRPGQGPRPGPGYSPRPGPGRAPGFGPGPGRPAGDRSPRPGLGYGGEDRAPRFSGAEAEAPAFQRAPGRPIAAPRPPAWPAQAEAADDPTAGPGSPSEPWMDRRGPAGTAPGRPPYGPGRAPGSWQRPPRPQRPVDSTPGSELVGAGDELVAGRRPVEEAFVAGRPAHRLLVVPQRRQALEKLVLHATRLRIPIVEVEGGTITSLAGFDGHQGVALVVAPRKIASPAEIVARASERREAPFVLVMDSLEDPQNVGTLLRSAEAAGVHGVIFPSRHQAPLSPAAIKASAGAVEHLLLAEVDDLPAALADLHGHGLRVVGAEAEAPLTLRQADLRGPLAIVVGSEGSGLSPAVRRRCDLFVRIPMRGVIGSLNASVAGSILLFEVTAQRDAGGSAEAGSGRSAIQPAVEATAATQPDSPAATQPDSPAPVPTSALEPDPALELASAEGTVAARKRPATARRAKAPVVTPVAEVAPEPPATTEMAAEPAADQVKVPAARRAKASPSTAKPRKSRAATRIAPAEAQSQPDQAVSADEDLLPTDGPSAPGDVPPHH